MRGNFEKISPVGVRKQGVPQKQGPDLQSGNASSLPQQLQGPALYPLTPEKHAFPKQGIKVNARPARIS